MGVTARTISADARPYHFFDTWNDGKDASGIRLRFFPVESPQSTSDHWDAINPVCIIRSQQDSLQVSNYYCERLGTASSDGGVVLEVLEL